MLKIGIIKQCFKEIEKSSHPRYRIGSVIFKGSRIISSGYNQFRSSRIPLQYKKFEDTLHAEQSALSNAKISWEKLKNCSILVMRTNASGNLSLSYPCNFCMESIVYSGIKWLYYSDRKGQIVKERI